MAGIFRQYEPHAGSHNTGGNDPITQLGGGVITSGTVADVRLSANIPRLDAANVWGATNNFNNKPVYYQQLFSYAEGISFPGISGGWITLDLNGANVFYANPSANFNVSIINP